MGVGLLTAIESNAAEYPPLSSSQVLLERRNITDLGADTCLQCELQTFEGGMGYEDPLIPRADNASAGTKFFDFNSTKVEDMLRNRLTPSSIQHFYTEIKVNS